VILNPTLNSDSNIYKCYVLLSEEIFFKYLAILPYVVSFLRQQDHTAHIEMVLKKIADPSVHKLPFESESH